jgi:hypothetical protein
MARTAFQRPRWPFKQFGSVHDQARLKAAEVDTAHPARVRAILLPFTCMASNIVRRSISWTRRSTPVGSMDVVAHACSWRCDCAE